MDSGTNTHRSRSSRDPRAAWEAREQAPRRGQGDRACAVGWSGANAKIREELGLSHAPLNPVEPQPFRDVPEA